MAKRIFQIVIVCLLLGYMLFGISFLNSKADQGLNCEKMEIHIDASEKERYLSEESIRKGLEKAGLNPEGKAIAEVNTGEIENYLCENRLIKNVECYKTVNGTVKLWISQRTPILRVMSYMGDYYIDKDGEKMPVPGGFATHVPLASGYVDDAYAQNELYKFVLFLQKDEFWDTEIEQIYIHKNKDMEIIPRKGNHHVLLGKFNDYPENLKKLQLFYKEGLDRIGWNRYSVINLKYKDRVICTKK